MYKAMIVDDEPLILQGLKDLINWESLDIEIAAEASCGTDALDILLTQNIHILITDINMSYMNGLELIKQIRKRNLNTKIVVLSGYDDFSYIKEAVKYGIENYLLKPVSETELLSTLQTITERLEINLYQIDILKNNFLTRWVSNHIDKEELMDKANFLNIDLGHKNYTVVVLKSLDGNTPTASISNNTMSNQIHLMETIILEKFNAVGHPILFRDLDGHLVIILSDFSKEQYDSVCNKILPSCIRNIQSFLNIRLFITVGSIEPTSDKVYQSYSFAKKLLEYRLVMPLKVIVTYNDTNKKALDHQQLLQFDYTEFKSMILLKNKEKAVLWIDEVFKRISKMPYLEPLSVQNLVLEILFFAISNIKSVNSDIDILYDYPDLYMNVLKLQTITDLDTWLKNTVTEFINILINSTKKNNSLINTISKYVQENYKKNINLDTIASEFDKNPAYIGQLFKKELGESFTNYINKIRIEKAKILLINNPSLTTPEISCAVGYYNTNYFYTIFKKFTGLTPSDFKSNPGI